MADEPKRRSDGTIEAGQGSLNPGGRPKLIREFQDWLKEKAYPQAQTALLECLASGDGKVRMMAVKEVHDRLFGKAPQAITNEDGTPLRMGLIFLPATKNDAG